MNADQSSLSTTFNLDNVLAVVLVAAILGACATGVFDVVRMMGSVA